MQNNLAALYSQNAAQRPAKKNFRNIPQAPERILDAPELLDDYYLNLLDWGPMNNVVRLLKCNQQQFVNRTLSFEAALGCRLQWLLELLSTYGMPTLAILNNSWSVVRRMTMSPASLGERMANTLLWEPHLQLSKYGMQTGSNRLGL